MDYLELPAPPPLDSLIHCFWFLRGNDGGGPPQTIVSDGRIDLVLHLANPFLRIGRDGESCRQATTILAGQLTEPLVVMPSGEADVVGIRFRTAAAGAVLQPRLSEFTNQAVSLGDVAPSFARALLEAAARHRDPHARVVAISATLSRFVRQSPDGLAHSAVRALNRIAAPSVRALSAEFGVSTRTFERRILDGTGLSPSVLRRALRFRRVFRMLDQAPSGTWATIAARAGYFDQAHLIRDFRQFAGATPSQFFRTEPELARAFIGPGDGADERAR